jgi:very-short-patch-repair endonuclease
MRIDKEWQNKAVCGPYWRRYSTKAQRTIQATHCASTLWNALKSSPGGGWLKLDPQDGKPGVQVSKTARVDYFHIDTGTAIELDGAYHHNNQYFRHTQTTPHGGPNELRSVPAQSDADIVRDKGLVRYDPAPGREYVGHVDAHHKLTATYEPDRAHHEPTPGGLAALGIEVIRVEPWQVNNSSVRQAIIKSILEHCNERKLAGVQPYVFPKLTNRPDPRPVPRTKKRRSKPLVNNPRFTTAEVKRDRDDTNPHLVGVSAAEMARQADRALQAWQNGRDVTGPVLQ